MITPDISAVHVREFCAAISPHEPVIVASEPQDDRFEFSDCFNNVDEMVRRRGGSPVRGWHITEWPGVFIEAEHHAIWRKWTGELLDPSPHRTPFASIAFLPDETLKEWDSRRNINSPLNDAPLIPEFLLVSRSLREDPCNSHADRRRKERLHRSLRAQLESTFGPEPYGSAHPAPQ